MKYTIVIERDKDGKINMKRTNKGFNPFELLGWVEFIKDELLEQIAGSMKPEIVRRKYIETKKEEKV